MKTFTIQAACFIRNMLACLVTQTFRSSPAAKQILPIHGKTMALSTNEQDIYSSSLWRTKTQSTCLFTVLLGNRTSQRHCSETSYDKGCPSTFVIGKYFGFFDWLLAKLGLVHRLNKIISGCWDSSISLHWRSFLYIASKWRENFAYKIHSWDEANMTVPIMSDREE